MTVMIPVYTDLNGVHRIEIFRETEDGTFRRTGLEPLRVLRENIVGIETKRGELISSNYDRGERSWGTPTVLPSSGRPASMYAYMRERACRQQLVVFSAPSLSGRLVRLDVHALRLKPSASRQVIALMLRRYAEAIALWIDRGPESPEPMLRAANG
jgi:hypothetical protein